MPDQTLPQPQRPVPPPQPPKPVAPQAARPTLPTAPQPAPAIAPPARPAVAQAQPQTGPAPVSAPAPAAPVPSVKAVPPNSSAPASRLLQNLQNVSAQPFQDPKAATTATTLPVAAPSLGAPPTGVTSPSVRPPVTSVPKETLSLDPLSPAKVPPANRKVASASGVGGFLQNSRRLVMGAVALLVLLVGGGAIWFFLSSRSTPTTPQTGTTPTGSSGRNITLTYWGLWEPAEVMQPLIDSYEQANPGVKINYVQQNSRQYRQRLQAAIRDGSGPDIFRFHNTWVPMLKTDLAPAPSTALSADAVRRDFYPVVSTDLVSGAQVLGVPLMYDGLALLYNQNMLQAANALPPSDWQQVRELAVRLTIKNGTRIERGGIALGTADNIDHFSDILAFMMLQNSVDLTTPTTPNAQSALEFYTIFSRVDQVWDSTLPPSVQAFAGEQVAMIFAPAWRIQEIQKQNPNLNIGVARLPQIDGTDVTWATYWAEGVSAQSRQKEEAWKFLTYLSQAEQLRTFHTTASSERGYGELYPRVSMANELKTNPLLAPYLDDALTAKSWYLSSDTLDEGLNDGLIQYYRDAVNNMNQGGSADRALQNALPGIQQVLSRYGLSSPPAQQ